MSNNPNDFGQKFAQKDSGGNTYDTGGGFNFEQRDMPSRPKGLMDKIDSAMSEIEAARYEEEKKAQIKTTTKTVAYYKCALCGKQRQDRNAVCAPEAVYE